MKQAAICTGLAVCLAFTAAGASPSAFAQVTTTNISVSDTGFSPSQITAILNQPVSLSVKNTGSKVHQFSIPYFYVFSENLKPGQSTKISFTPSTAGRFDITSDPSGENRPEFMGHFVVTDQK